MTNSPSRGGPSPEGRPGRRTAARLSGIIGIAATIIAVIIAGAITRSFGFLSRDSGASAHVNAGTRGHLKAATSESSHASVSRPRHTGIGELSTASMSAGGLTIQATWPSFQGCDGATTELAVTHPGQSTSALKLSPEFADDASAFEIGHLYVRFTVAGNEVAVIKNIRAEIYRVSSEAPTRVYYLEGASCVDTYNRAFQLNLDSRTLSDGGTGGDHDDDDDGGRSAGAVAPLHLSVHVSRTDPAQFRVDVDGCGASYQWGLEIAYAIGNREFVKIIGAPRDPFRVVAAPNDPIPAYGINLASRHLSVHRLGTLTSSASCQTQFSRP